MSTLKTTNIQNASSATTNIALDTSGNVTVGGGITASSGTVVMSSPYTMRNKIINGAMVIDQRNAGASVTQTTGLVYPLDRFVTNGSVTSKFTAQQSSTAPNGFSKSLLITSSSAYTVGASEYFLFRQAIEGFNCADLAWGTASAQSVTLSFWVRSSLTGTFGGNLMNASVNRNYVFSYTISSANTWEQKSITITGDTTGTWATDNTVGIYVDFSLGAGASATTTAGSWGATVYRAPTGQTSIVGTNGATFYITGVQLERGTVATPFEYRNYQQELAMCQRYYQVMAWQTGSNWPSISGYITNGGIIDASFMNPVQMRTQPTTTKNGTWNVSGNNGQPTVLGTTQYGFSLRITGTAAGTAYALGQNSTNTVTNDAEL